MNNKPKVQEEFEKYVLSDEQAYLAACEEAARLDVTGLLLEVLKERDIEQKELANLLKKKESYVSKVFGGVQNVTLRTVSDFFAVMGKQVTFGYRDVGEYFGINPTCFGISKTEVSDDWWTLAAAFPATAFSNVVPVMGTLTQEIQAEPGSPTSGESLHKTLQRLETLTCTAA